MSRLLALVAVAVIAFACAPRPVTVAPVEPLGEVTDADEPFLVDSEIEVDVPYLNESIGCLPETDRLDKQTFDEMVTADRIGPPDDGMGGTLPRPLSPPATPLSRRFWKADPRWLRESGGDANSEQAVGRGLAWLARQQRPDGDWVGDGADKDHFAATGLALLAFLGNGHTHKPPTATDAGNPPYRPACRCCTVDSLPAANGQKPVSYQRGVMSGLGFLMKNCPISGPNAGRMSTDITAQAVATLALCEAYGMTNEPVLKPYAQAALNYLQKAQGPNGSWSDAAGTDGDIFAAGWALQALHAGRLARDLVVDDLVVKKARKFLDRVSAVSAGDRKAAFGVVSNADAKPGTTPTAIGLLCRHTFDGWGPNHPGMVDGVTGLAKNPPSEANRDPVYLYYATQVLFRYEGEDWKDWNEGPKIDGVRTGGVRALLVKSQVRKDGANLGSWEPDAGAFGTRCGRLGTTALSVLTLETYYRYPSLPKLGREGG